MLSLLKEVSCCVLGIGPVAKLLVTRKLSGFRVLSLIEKPTESKRGPTEAGRGIGRCIGCRVYRFCSLKRRPSIHESAGAEKAKPRREPAFPVPGLAAWRRGFIVGGVGSINVERITTPRGLSAADLGGALVLQETLCSRRARHGRGGSR